MTATPATNPLTYNGYVSQIGTMAVAGSFTPTTNTVINGVTYLSGVTYGGTITSPDVNFNNVIPQMLNYAELRIQRDLDMLPFHSSNTNYALTAGSNVLNIDVADFVAIDTVAVTSGTFTAPLLPVSKEYIQNTWNDSALTYRGIPTVFAVYGGDSSTAGDTSNILLFGPYPASNYPVTLTGLIRMPSLAKYATTAQASSSTTFISSYLPDLLIMASMIYISAYQRNFGRMNDDPQMAMTYESQYQALMKGAASEEYRKKFEASAWTSKSSSPFATPTRG